MNVLLSIFASDILPVFVIAGAGFLLGRKLQASVQTLSRVSFYALTPCLAFKMLATSKMTGPDAGRMVLMAVLVTAAMGLLARVAAIPLGLNRAELSAFLLVSMFSNGGNYGPCSTQPDVQPTDAEIVSRNAALRWRLGASSLKKLLQVHFIVELVA